MVPSRPVLALALTLACACSAVAQGASKRPTSRLRPAYVQLNKGRTLRARVRSVGKTLVLLVYPEGRLALPAARIRGIRFVERLPTAPGLEKAWGSPQALDAHVGGLPRTEADSLLLRGLLAVDRWPVAREVVEQRRATWLLRFVRDYAKDAGARKRAGDAAALRKRGRRHLVLTTGLEFVASARRHRGRIEVEFPEGKLAFAPADVLRLTDAGESALEDSGQKAALAVALQSEAALMEYLQALGYEDQNAALLRSLLSSAGRRLWREQPLGDDYEDVERVLDVDPVPFLRAALLGARHSSDAYSAASELARRLDPDGLEQLGLTLVTVRADWRSDVGIRCLATVFAHVDDLGDRDAALQRWEQQLEGNPERLARLRLAFGLQAATERELERANLPEDAEVVVALLRSLRAARRPFAAGPTPRLLIEPGVPSRLKQEALRSVARSSDLELVPELITALSDALASVEQDRGLIGALQVSLRGLMRADQRPRTVEDWALLWEALKPQFLASQEALEDLVPEAEVHAQLAAWETARALPLPDRHIVAAALASLDAGADPRVTERALRYLERLGPNGFVARHIVSLLERGETKRLAAATLARIYHRTPSERPRDWILPIRNSSFLPPLGDVLPAGVSAWDTDD